MSEGRKRCDKCGLDFSELPVVMTGDIPCPQCEVKNNPYFPESFERNFGEGLADIIKLTDGSKTSDKLTAEEALQLILEANGCGKCMGEDMPEDEPCEEDSPKLCVSCILRNEIKVIIDRIKPDNGDIIKKVGARIIKIESQYDRCQDGDDIRRGGEVDGLEFVLDLLNRDVSEGHTANCDWVGLGTCPQCGEEVGRVFP